MRTLFIMFLSITVFSSPVSAVQLTFTSAEATMAEPENESAGIREKRVQVTPELVKIGRVNKQVIFRGNKSARFAEFENLDLAPQLANAKSLLADTKPSGEMTVVNYAKLPAVNETADAVEKVETKITARVPNNPAIAGYGRSNRNVYASLKLKRAQDAKSEKALQAKLDQFQVKPGRMKGKIARADRYQQILN